MSTTSKKTGLRGPSLVLVPRDAEPQICAELSVLWKTTDGRTATYNLHCLDDATDPSWLVEQLRLIADSIEAEGFDWTEGEGI